MPPQALCTANDEACDPDMFNETIRAFTSDGHGRFAFVATQEASHVMKEGEAPETVASQDVLYVYQKRGSGWRYCQVALQGSEVESTSQKLRSEFESTIQRCTPNRIVFPDLKTQKYNPFVH